MNDSFLQFLIDLAEKRVLPDPIIRFGIRKACENRIRCEAEKSQPSFETAEVAFAKGMAQGPIAFVPEKANEQHYEMPPAFMKLALGARMKYSGCYWPDGVESLDRAEEQSLAMVCDRAEVADGMTILELGCGWGSLSLWMAEKYPNSQIVGVSNSSFQREFIERRAREKGLNNLTIVTCDINQFDPGRSFDRVVSIEMFEHLWNYKELLHRISGWLNTDGKLFVHIFTHKDLVYKYETDGAGNWMGRHFFTAGLMPSHNLFQHFQQDLTLVNQWRIDGTHYEKTSNAWLRNLDKNEEFAIKLLNEQYGDESQVQFQRWRLFYMACAELFGYKNGSEWGVSHYLFTKP